MTSELKLVIRQFAPADEKAVIGLWQRCNLVRPVNDPHKDIERKMIVSPELFLVGLVENKITATAMGGYDGHRGSVNYVAVDLAYQKHGFGRLMMEEIERKLLAVGCPKINLYVRKSNLAVTEFYGKLGYAPNRAISLRKRLTKD